MAVLSVLLLARPTSDWWRLALTASHSHTLPGSKVLAGWAPLPPLPVLPLTLYTLYYHYNIVILTPNHIITSLQLHINLLYCCTLFTKHGIIEFYL